MLAKGFKTSMYGPVSYSQLSLISMTKDSFLQGLTSASREDLMLNIQLNSNVDMTYSQLCLLFAIQISSVFM